MNITIIGGGHMGNNLVRGFLKGTFFHAKDITVIDVAFDPLYAIKQIHPEIHTAIDDDQSLSKADIIILAVKPWLIPDVIVKIKSLLNYQRQVLISIAAGITLSKMEEYLHKTEDVCPLPALFRVIPNTAIAVKESVSLIVTNNASDEQKELIFNIFNELGIAVFIDEEKFSSGTALTSCGIAYFLRFVRAATLAGVEMGFPAKLAQELIAYTMKGAAELLLQTQTNPEEEIDKVTTPGGLTIKGLNTLEAYGFSNAVIQAIKAIKN